MDTKIRAIITGATGMVGEGVLNECLNHPQVEAVLIINRKPSGFSHIKLKEIIHPDFFDLSAIADQLSGYNACYFCLGVSSIGMKEPEYYRLTYTLTMHFAETLIKQNADITFCYVSGGSTDSSEKGKVMWARVKGKTENDLAKLPFKQEFNFRPGLMKAAKNAKNVLTYYKYFIWMYPFLRAVFPKFVSTLAEVGQAMINVTLRGYDKQVLEVKDIVEVAKR
jgi:nucleoside-diphosphate-sugar epimerase